MPDIKLLHGDCIQLIDNILDESIDLILTDIPYNISQENNFQTMKDREGRNGIDFGKWDYDFDVSCLAIFQSKLRKGGSLFLFHEYMQYADICNTLSKLELKDRIIWEKTNAMIRNSERRYIANAEIASWYTKPGDTWVFNRQYSPYDGSVYRYPSESGGGFDRYHPCQKPQALLEDIIKRHSNKGDTILDPFMGSGSTGVAAYNLDRNFIGIEIDNDYYSIAQQRLEAVKCGATPKISKNTSKTKALF